MADSKKYEITVKTHVEYIPDQSDSRSGAVRLRLYHHHHQYRQRAAQLISRHWVITDATNQVQEVRGLGVIGEQPLLKPGESFEYTSGCVHRHPGRHHARQLPDDGGGRHQVRRADCRIYSEHAARIALAKRLSHVGWVAADQNSALRVCRAARSRRLQAKPTFRRKFRFAGLRRKKPRLTQPTFTAFYQIIQQIELESESKYFHEDPTCPAFYSGDFRLCHAGKTGHYSPPVVPPQAIPAIPPAPPVAVPPLQSVGWEARPAGRTKTWQLPGTLSNKAASRYRNSRHGKRPALQQRMLPPRATQLCGNFSNNISSPIRPPARRRLRRADHRLLRAAA